ncbi:MAG: hypothetical protein IMZ66_03580, partial [Planctomycetes bacterium]|nr:hypothetical protein [Planctomycetota bacterium]
GAHNAIEKRRLLLDRQIQVVEYVDYFGFHNHVETFLESLLLASGNEGALARVRPNLRSRIQVHYASEDEGDGRFVWHYVFREGAITLSEDPQRSQWDYLKKSISEGLRALDHLVLIVTPSSLADTETVETVATALQAAEAAGVLVVFLAVGFDSRPEYLARAAPANPMFLLHTDFSESDLEPFRQCLAEDIKSGHRQP